MSKRTLILSTESEDKTTWWRPISTNAALNDVVGATRDYTKWEIIITGDKVIGPLIPLLITSLDRNHPGKFIAFIGEAPICAVNVTITCDEGTIANNGEITVVDRHSFGETLMELLWLYNKHVSPQTYTSGGLDPKRMNIISTHSQDGKNERKLMQSIKMRVYAIKSHS